MSGRKIAVALTLGAVFGVCLIAAVVMAIVGIWSGDDRWGLTALIIGCVGFVGAFGTATYPGWDW